MAENVDQNATASGRSGPQGEEKVLDVYLLTQRIEELTVEQMKKMEIQKMEDNMTIITLERDYNECKRNLTFSRERCNEAQKKITSQEETLNKLKQIHKALMEKCNELKNFQSQIIETNLLNAEKTLINSYSKNSELSNKFDSIIKNEKLMKELQNKVYDCQVIVNDTVKKQIEDIEQNIKQYHPILEDLQERLKLKRDILSKEKSDQTLQNLIDDSRRKISELAMENEEIQKKIQVEIDKLSLDIKALMETLKQLKLIIEEHTNLRNQLQAELEVFQSQNTNLNNDLKVQQKKQQELYDEIKKKEEVNKLLKSSYEENINNVNNELIKAQEFLKSSKENFTNIEERFQQEISELHRKYAEEKNTIKKCKMAEIDLAKLKQEKRMKEKEITNYAKQKMDKLRKFNEEVMKWDTTLKNQQKKNLDSEANLKELEMSRDELVLKLNSVKLIKQSANSTIFGTPSNSSENLGNVKKMIENNKDDDSRSSQLFDEMVQNTQADNCSSQDSLKMGTSENLQIKVEKDSFKMPMMADTLFSKKKK